MNWSQRLHILLIGVLILGCLIISAIEECKDDTHFMCRSDKKCIESSLICNKRFDCDDHSDEENCDCLEPQWYLCNDNVTCISSSFRCDGHFDCPSNDDEEKCEHYVPHHEVTECTADEFKCNSDGVCLPLEWVCDGTKNCFDGSDEIIGCTTLKQRCHGFTCKNGHCLTDRSWVCDGVNDCSDNSDEEKCNYDCTLQNKMFLCGNNVTCIALDKVCDGVNDCYGGDDERNDCQSKKKNSSSDCAKVNCAPLGSCHILPNGPTCVCPKGFHYDEQKRECADINECQRFGACSQGCVNTLGSYKCSCAPKFRMYKNNRTCKASGLFDPLLLYAATRSIGWLTLKSKHQKTVADNLNQVIGISYDGEYVYWTDISVQVESIMKSKVDGTEMETLFSAGLGKPEDIAVDYITGNIYFTDNEFQHLAVCSNDGRYCRALITENVHRPRGLALYVQRGKMYWTDWGRQPMIAVASMDGTAIQSLVTQDIHWPNGLALDWPNERLYWVDAKLKFIESCKLDGSDRRLVISKVSKHPYGIAVFQDTLFWSDWDSKSIQSCDKFTGKNRTTIIRDSVIYDIHVYHPAMQTFVRNPCIQHECSHLCLLNMNMSYTCECPKYMELSVDQHKCRYTGKQKIVLIAIGNRLVTFEHQSFGHHQDGEGKTLKYRVNKMTFNSITGNIIACDNLRKVIFQVNSKNYAIKELITKNLGNITAMSFDYLSNNLYWTDAERSTIEVYSFNTQHRAVVQHFMGAETPIALAALPELGKLFVVLRSSGHTHMDMIEAHGRGTHFHLLEENLGNGPIALFPDHEEKNVFWTDFEQSKISYTDFNGQIHHTFLYDINNPLSLTIVGEDLFWSTSNSLKLNWCQKYTYVDTKSMHIEHPFKSETSQNMELLAITPLTVSKHTCLELGYYGGCSHICIAMGPTTHACLCSAGTVFNDASNTTCIPVKDCYFRCGSGECISESQKCDGAKDCQDFSDEEDCKNAKKYVACSPDEFTCHDRLQCINRSLRCDFNINCDDGSDEKDCKTYNKDTKCHQNQFLCSNGRCIDSNSLCDGVKDCSAGEDELESNCRKLSSRTCHAGEFKCSNNQCIPQPWVCDGALDCSNDEENCAPEECSENMKRCEHGTCISKSLWCNGENDCGDFSDESNCENYFEEDIDEITCGETNLFQCKHNKTICLDMAKRCNGKADCPKGEDELDCDLCAENQFKCGSGECIPMKWHCDNQGDCSDISDELNCTKYTNGSHDQTHFHPACSAHEFKCKNEECVDWDRVCNGEPDGCSDASDEGEYCEISCKNSPCHQKCIRSPNGAVCACFDGFTLSADQKNCNDIDECSTSITPCAQMCKNSNGSYECSCYSGFALRTDKSSCKSVDSPKFMFYSAYDTIYQLGPHLKTVKSANGSKILGLDMHFDKKLLYFTIEDSEALYELNWTESGQINLVKSVGMPTQVAVDWITDNVYFIDKSRFIHVCHMENRACITLIEFKEGEHIKSLAVDALHHRLFYVIVKKSDFAMPESQIFVRHLDGSRMQMVSKDSFFVPSITADIYTERVYYVGLDTRTIWSVKYDGTGKQLMISKNEFITRPIEINLFESHAYVSNSGSKIVAVCQMYGDRQCKSFPLNVNQPDNLVIVQKSRQKPNENSCANVNCKSICIPADLGAKCICDFGHIVGADDECSSVGYQRPIFQKKMPFAITTPATTNLASKTSTSISCMTLQVLTTIFAVMVIVVAIMAGLCIYKRIYVKKNFNISLHMLNQKDNNLNDDDDDGNIQPIKYCQQP